MDAVSAAAQACGLPRAKRRSWMAAVSAAQAFQPHTSLDTEIYLTVRIPAPAGVGIGATHKLGHGDLLNRYSFSRHPLVMNKRFTAVRNSRQIISPMISVMIR